MATSGDFLLATSGDFSMATDSFGRCLVSRQGGLTSDELSGKMGRSSV